MKYLLIIWFSIVAIQAHTKVSDENILSLDGHSFRTTRADRCSFKARVDADAGQIILTAINDIDKTCSDLGDAFIFTCGLERKKCFTPRVKGEMHALVPLEKGFRLEVYNRLDKVIESVQYQILRSCISEICKEDVVQIRKDDGGLVLARVVGALTEDEFVVRPYETRKSWDEASVFFYMDHQNDDSSFLHVRHNQIVRQINGKCQQNFCKNDPVTVTSVEAIKNQWDFNEVVEMKRRGVLKALFTAYAFVEIDLGDTNALLQVSYKNLNK